jgi:hypothetical protein
MQDERYQGMDSPHFLGDFVSFQAGHVIVKQDEVNRVLPEDLQSIVPVGCGQDGVAVLPKDRIGYLEHKLVVVDAEHDAIPGMAPDSKTSWLHNSAYGELSLS